MSWRQAESILSVTWSELFLLLLFVFVYSIYQVQSYFTYFFHHIYHKYVHPHTGTSVIKSSAMGNSLELIWGCWYCFEGKPMGDKRPVFPGPWTERGGRIGYPLQCVSWEGAFSDDFASGPTKSCQRPCCFGSGKRCFHSKQNLSFQVMYALPAGLPLLLLVIPLQCPPHTHLTNAGPI